MRAVSLERTTGTSSTSPRGRDTAPGTEQHPWATLAGARNNLRKLRAAITGPVIVSLRDGIYPLSETARFALSDDRVIAAGFDGMLLALPAN